MWIAPSHPPPAQTYAYPPSHYQLYTPQQHYYGNQTNDVQEDEQNYLTYKAFVSSDPDVENDEHLIEDGQGFLTNVPVEDNLGTFSSEASGKWSSLDLSHMGLQHLRVACLHTYGHLTSLYLSHNRLAALPSGLGLSLPALTTLDLSFNMFTSPAHLACLGDLLCLEGLSLYHNQLAELPAPLGRLWRLKNLVLDHNPIVNPPREVLVQGVYAVISYLRDRMSPGPPPPNREFIYINSAPTGTNIVNKTTNKLYSNGSDVNNNNNTSSNNQNNRQPPLNITSTNKKAIGAENRSEPNSRTFSVFCYNILAESYATPDRHIYTPSWALSWSYRKAKLLQEMLRQPYDILCLQEVETDHFYHYFEPELASVRYAGVFRPKSRARTMEDWAKAQVDGCAIFYRQDRFAVVEEHVLEYQSCAMYKYKEFDADALTRVISKDNIALILVMKQIDGDGSESDPGTAPSPVFIVANTHIYWDPQFSDVKLLQVHMLLDKIAQLTTVPGAPYKNASVIITGDFNSVPESAPYALLANGKVSGDHPDLAAHGLTYGAYSAQGFTNPLPPLVSAYAHIGEPKFTNYVLDFVGTLDYIFYTPGRLQAQSVLEMVDEEVVRASRLPNPYMCSDHVSLACKFQFVP